MENITQRSVNSLWFRCFLGWLVFQTLLFGVIGWLLFLDVSVNGSRFSYTRKGVAYAEAQDNYEEIEPIRKHK